MYKPTALFDMDGTLVNWDGAMARDMEAMLGPNEELPVVPGAYSGVFAYDWDACEKTPHLKARMDAIKRQPGWWRNLKWLDRGREMVTIAQFCNYKLHILTKGPKKIPGAWAEKLDWRNTELPQAKITITEEKHRFRGSVLFEDWIPYIGPWLDRNRDGLVVIVDQPWNRDFIHPRAYRYKGPEQAQELTELLSKHRDSILTSRSKSGTMPSSPLNERTT